MRCKQCAFDQFYSLSDGRLKCKRCGKRVSPKKINFSQEAISLFCGGFNALESSKKLGCSYKTISTLYKKLRNGIAIYAQEYYQNNQDKIAEYEEYIYIPKSKNKKNRLIYEGIDLLCFDCGGKIFTLILPSLKSYQEFENDALKKYFAINKIRNLKSMKNQISLFFEFFEEQIVRYKGVSDENFFFYLKEIEFCFNYSFEERIKICQSLL